MLERHQVTHKNIKILSSDDEKEKDVYPLLISLISMDIIQNMLYIILCDCFTTVLVR